ncbi:MAG: 3'(2'),5'-bisphosphate nucleotidase [Alphaproteobacteria bacterium]|nr:3'(2'),5'-bisphosphate nucleotidase [Alphaproteobacteria bacterium]
MNAMTQPWTDALRRLADEAGREIMRHYGTATAHLKSDASPVTVADEAAERIIVAGLARLDPTIPIIAEENVAREGFPVTAAERFWLVDPLDGTKEYLNKNGEFTVNIGLIVAGLPTLGVVLAPALGVSYFAADDGCAYATTEGSEARRIQARPVPSTGAVAAISRSHLDKDSEAYLAKHGITAVRSAGSSLKFGLVACGETDVYPRFGRTMEWDTAAGHAVLRAAGGSVRDLAGIEITYGKNGFANPAFIARGRDS